MKSYNLEVTNFMDMNQFHDNFMLTNSLPMGLAMGMAMNENAMNNYSKLTEFEKEKLLAESKNVKSKAEMNQIIKNLGDGLY